MSKENLEQFMKQVDESEDLQAKIGGEISGDALIALGAAHGCEFSIEDVQAGAELNDEQLERVSGGADVVWDRRREGDVNLINILKPCDKCRRIKCTCQWTDATGLG